jgi:hypothetical protein
MRRAAALTAAGLVAAIAAVLLLRGERETGRASTPGGLRGGAAGNAAWSREPHLARSLRAPGPGSEAPVIASGGQSRDTSIGAPEAESVRDSPVTAFLASHSSDELALFARFERLTGRAAPPTLIALVERRRAGVPSDELVVLATRLFAGDPLGRAAALEWLRDTSRR